MAVVFTLVQTKQIRINIHKRNNTKKYNTVQIIRNTVKKVHILLKHPHIAKQVKTTTVQVKITTVQDAPTWNSHNLIKYPQHNVTLMYMELLSAITSP